MQQFALIVGNDTPLDPFSEAGLRKEIGKRLDTLLVCHDKAEKAMQQLYSLLQDTPEIIKPAHAIHRAFSCFFSDMLVTLSEKHQGISNATVILADIKHKYYLPDNILPEYRYSFLNNEIGLAKVLAKIKNQYDYAGLADTLAALGAGLEAKGIRESANRIVSFLNIEKYEDENSYHPRKTKTGMVFSRLMYPSYDGYGADDIRLMKKMIGHFRTMENDTEVTGVSQSMAIIYKNFLKNMLTSFSSRTKINKGGVITCTVYKEKIELAIQADQTDALLAFVATNASVEIHEIGE